METDEKTLELLSSVLNGDEGAFGQLAEKYKAVVEASAVSVIRSMERKGLLVTSDTSEDMKQEARLALYRAALSYEPEGDGKNVTFGLYAKICIRNAMVSQLRRMSAEKRRADRVYKRSADGLNGGKTDDSSDIVPRIMIEQLLEKNADILSPYELKVLRLYLSGRKINEISEELGKMQKSVNNALYRIRVKLKNND